MPGPWCRRSRCRPPIPRPMPGCSRTSPPGASATRPTSRSIAATSMPPAAALWLDVTGCAHLFGGEAALREDLLARLRRQGLAAAAAIADTPGAAWAVARYGDDADRAAGRRPGGAGAFARGGAPPGARYRPDAGAPGARADRESLSPAAPGAGRALRRRAHHASRSGSRAWSTSRSRRARRRRRTAPSWPSPSRSPRPRRSRR